MQVTEVDTSLVVQYVLLTLTACIMTVLLPLITEYAVYTTVCAVYRALMMLFHATPQ